AWRHPTHDPLGPCWAADAVCSPLAQIGSAPSRSAMMGPLPHEGTPPCFARKRDPIPHLDTGNTGFMLPCCSPVMRMKRGLAFFYGGLVGGKNVLAIMMQSFVSMGWTTVLWWLCGFSMCFSGDYKSGTDFAGIIGNFDWAFLKGITLSTPSPANDSIPMLV